MELIDYAVFIPSIVLGLVWAIETTIRSNARKNGRNVPPVSFWTQLPDFVDERIFKVDKFLRSVAIISLVGVGVVIGHGFSDPLGYFDWSAMVVLLLGARSPSFYLTWMWAHAEIRPTDPSLQTTATTV